MTENPRRALVIVHDPHGGPAALGRALVERGWTLDEHQVTHDMARPNEARPFPPTVDHDLVVVMGSVHSVYDEGSIGSWIGAEIDLIRTAHEEGIPVLGICFGAQSAAAALGGSVELSPITEIGWYHLEGDDVPIDRGPWLQWHHDRLDPPPGAEVLATTPETVQLFRLGATVGVQFHPEVDLDHVRTWLEEAPDDYLAAYGVDRAAFLAETERQTTMSVPACGRLLALRGNEWRDRSHQGR